MNKILLILLSSFVLFSCNEEKAQSKQTTTNETTNKDCLYSVNPEEFKFEWTAFKTTAKVGVKGTFNEIDIINANTEGDIAELLINTEFIIHLNSLNSGNEERDKKIIDLFFGNLKNAAEFKGKILEVNGTNEKGELVVLLTINELENAVKMIYKTNDDMLKFAGNLDLSNWETENSFGALNAACKEYHTGEDGISKTWTEVYIEVSTILKKECK